MGRPAKDLTGMHFGSLTVLSREIVSSTDKRVAWRCLCSCGNEVIVKSNNLLSGHKISCNCFRSERMAKLNLKHGDSYSRLYNIYEKMKQRCTNPKDCNYANYGARGIKVCDEWKKYETFRDWALSHGYCDYLSIDRIDVNGDYSPENCRWATGKEQSNNRRSSVKLEHNGEVRTLAEWCQLLGLNYKTVSRRYLTGKSTEQILSKESLKHGRSKNRAAANN